MSISSAPAATASRVSSSLSSMLVRPDGKPVATVATATPEPSSARGRPRPARVHAHRRHDGISGCVGAGQRPWPRAGGPCPGVSWPSSVVRSTIETARRMAGLLRLGLDGALAEHGGALVHPDPVDRRDSASHAVQRTAVARFTRPGRLRDRPACERLFRHREPGRGARSLREKAVDPCSSSAARGPPRPAASRRAPTGRGRSSFVWPRGRAGLADRGPLAAGAPRRATPPRRPRPLRFRPRGQVRVVPQPLALDALAVLKPASTANSRRPQSRRTCKCRSTKTCSGSRSR